MTMLRRVVPAEVTALGDDEVEIRMSTGQLARDGHILVPEGCVLDNYRRNPIQLWQHDPACPVGRNDEISVTPGGILARTRFAPAGVSAKADEVRGLVKAGIVNAVSVGFDPLDGEPLDPKRPRGGMRFTRWELLECSFVSVPADTGAIVTARELARADTADSPPAQSAAAERKPQQKRGMYGIAQLACALESLGYVHECAEMEAAWEADDSAVPALIMDAIKAGCTALLAMTAEECAEMIGGDDADVGMVTMAGQSAAARFRRVRQIVARAGKAISAANAERIGQAQQHHDKALEQHGVAEEQHRCMDECYGAMCDSHEAVRAAHERLGDHLDAAKAAVGPENQEATDALSRCSRAHAGMTRNLDAITKKQAEAADAQDALGDAHRGIAREIRGAKRALAPLAGDPDSDTQDVQTSDGDGDSGGSTNDRAWRQRRARLRQIAAAA